MAKKKSIKVDSNDLVEAYFAFRLKKAGNVNGVLITAPEFYQLVKSCEVKEVKENGNNDSN